MERLQAATECSMYLQCDQNSHQQNLGPDIFRSQQADPVRNLQGNRHLNPGPMMGNNKQPRVMPDHFNGSGSWFEFINHFEICVASMSGITNKKPSISL